jgi:L-fuconolactonase
MSRIDSHLHIWDLKRGGYDWLTPSAGELYRSFLPDEAASVLADSAIDGAVLVQAADTFAETVYLLDVAQSNDWVAGVVGWVQLDNPDLVVQQLDRLQSYTALCGVRHLIHVDPRHDFLELAPVRASLLGLASRGVALDIPDAWPRHLAQVTALTRDIPELKVVIDHLAKPPRGRGDFGAWRDELAIVAQGEHVAAKISGLRLGGTDYSASALMPVWETALELFGPARLMWGSDWPMTVPDGGYKATFDVLSELISTLSRGEQQEIFSGTARRVYGLGG